LAQSKLSLLVVDDDPEFRQSLATLLERDGFQVATAGSLAEGRDAVRGTAHDAVLVDQTLPDGLGSRLLDGLDGPNAPEMVVITGHGSVLDAVEAMKEGALDYLTKPVDVGKLRTVLANVRRMRALEREVSQLREELRLRGRFGAIIGRSDAMQPVFDMIERVAPTDASVLIHGESGTGKEIVAQTIHEMSKRRDAMLLPVNCGAITESLIESELFGHERGSFTGADRTHKGVFERADGGSLLLDEITEMPVHLQAKLLRVLETGVVFRVGGSTQLRTNVRVLAATNRDPQEAIRQGKLRGDLFFRLAVFSIRLPPLRERQGDASLLATHFLAKLNEQNGTDKTWAPGALADLEQREWKGNVRELKNAVQRAYILSNTELRAADAVSAPATPEAKPAGTTLPIQVGSTIADAERELILATLEHVGGNKPAAAKMLGISLKTLYIRLNLYRVAKS
jgi:two-component system, NtrC family, response regulator AtoC